MKYITAFFFLLFCSAGFTQTASPPVVVQPVQTTPVPDSLAWSLQQCIAYAQSHNIGVQQQQLNVQAAKSDLAQSRGNFLPAVNGYASHTYQYGLTIDRFTNTFANTQVVSDNLYLSGRLTLFSGLQNYNLVAQNRYLVDAGNFQQEQVKMDLSLSVALAYLAVLYADEQLSLARGQAALTDAQLARTKIITDEGALPRGAFADLQAQYALDQVNVISAQHALTLAYLSLTQLMNLDSLNGFAILRPLLPGVNELLLASQPQQVYQLALQTQPRILKAEMNYRSAEKGVAVAYGALSPQISLVGSIGTGYSGAAKTFQSSSYGGLDTIGYTTSGTYVVSPYYNATYTTTPYRDQLNNNLNRTIGVEVSIPICNHFQARSSIARAKIQRESALLSEELERQQLKKSIDQLYADARSGFEKMQACVTALEAAETAYGYAEEKFNNGAGNAYDYEAAKNRLATAQLNLAQSKYDYYFRLKMLDYYQGKPLAW